MRILVLAELFPPDMGGGSTRAFNVVKGLVSLGHEVAVVTAFPHYPIGKIPRKYRRKLMCVETVGGARVIRVWVPPLASRGLARRLMLFLSFCVSSLFALPFIGRVDVVWAANPNVFSVYSALVYGLFKGCPVVQNVDDLWPEELYNLGMLRSRVLQRVAEFVSWLAYRASAAITPISPAYMDVILNRYGVDSRRVHVVPAGVV
jgi:glycosyltransferase involved in cell wall biosynthesis